MVRIALAALAVGAATPAQAAEVEPASSASVASTISDRRIDESSSLAVSARYPGIAYTLNDGHKPMVFSIDIATGRVVGTTSLRTSDLSDPEAVAVDGRGQVWVSDTGDNFQQHRRAALYAFAEKRPRKHRSATAIRYSIAYSDGRAHNVESLLIDPVTDAKYVVTKNFDGPGTVFALPNRLRRNRLNIANDLGRPLPARVSDGAFTPDGSRALVRDDANIYVLDPATWGVVQEVSAPPVRQGESLAFNPDGTAILLGSEGTPSPLIWVGFDPVSGLVETQP